MSVTVSNTNRSQTMKSVESLLPLLNRTNNNKQPIVLMTCGIAGSGKTTLAKSIISSLPHFNRLSIDEIIFEKHGLYGVNYRADPSIHRSFVDEADEIYKSRLARYVEEGEDVVAEKSFWSRAERDEYKHVVEEGGGRWILVHLPVEKEVLWRRICDRSVKERDASSAFQISRELFEAYWTGFEHPDGEGEIVLKIRNEEVSTVPSGVETRGICTLVFN